MSKYLLLVAILILLGPIAYAQPTSAPAASSDPYLPKSVVEESIKSVPCKIPERREGAKKLFLNAGGKGGGH